MNGRRAHGFRPIGKVAASVVGDMKFRRQVERLHRLGPRVTAEFLAEIAAERGIGTVIDQKLATYVDLDVAAIEAAGGERFWSTPLHEFAAPGILLRHRGSRRRLRCPL